MKGALYIYSNCAIDLHQVFANMSSILGGIKHTKYLPFSGHMDGRTLNPMSIFQ